MKRLIPILFFAILISSVCFGHCFFYPTISPTENACITDGEVLYLDFQPLFFRSWLDSSYYDGYEYDSYTYIIGKHFITAISVDVSHFDIRRTSTISESLYIHSISETSPYIITYENSNQIARIYPDMFFGFYGEIIYTEEFCNTPRNGISINGYNYVVSADFDPIDSTYGQGMLWKLNESFEVIDSLEIGMNPTHLIGPIGTPYQNEIHVLCTGDNESTFGTIYIICKNCFEIIDSLWLGGNPEYLAYDEENGYVYACVSNPDSVGGGKLLYYDFRSTEVICDITSSGNELFGSNFNRYHVFSPDYPELYIPSIDSNWVEIVRADSSGIYARNIEHIGIGVSDVVIHYFDGSIEENIVPNEYNIFSVFPNPFNSSCIFDIPGDADIEIFDIEGRLIEKIDGNSWSPESHVQSGVYLAKMTYENQTYSKKIIYLK